MNEQLTASDIQKIEEEINYRKVELRPKLLEDLKEARAQGDLSENFEYYAAKRANNKNNSRIRYLERMLGTAEVIEDDSKEDEVGINNWVTIYIEEDDAEETYKIVTPIRANSLKGFISIESPLGKALLKHKVGDKVEVKVNDSYSYIAEIRDLDASTDDSEDTIASY
ncbi:MAG: transcription elongation factor GreA [Lachnospiraceae bacterium]|nr:transcription elongation factor GreA [Lachnospiraceae bacterium]